MATVRWRAVSMALAAGVALCGGRAAAGQRSFQDGVDLSGWRATGKVDGSGAAAGMAVKLEFFKRRVGSQPTAELSRTVRLAEIAEVRMKFRLGDPALMGMGLQLAQGKQYYRVTAAGERFHLNAHGPGLKHFYGGPLWRAGETYEIRIAIVEMPKQVDADGKTIRPAGRKLRAWIVPGDGLPRFQRGYTRTVPPGWLSGPVTLSAGCRFAKDNVGTARLLSVAIYKHGEPIPQDVPHSRTVAESLAKYRTLREGRRTPALAALVKKLRSEAAPSWVVPKRRFEVQMWDGGKAGYLGWSAETVREIAKVYTMLQFRYPPAEAVELLGKHGGDMGVAIYIVTRQPEYFDALRRSPHVVTTALYKGKGRTKTNFFSGDFMELSAQHSLIRLARWMRTGLVRRVMIDSEYKVLVGSDALTRAAAKADGVKKFQLYATTRPGPYTRIVDDDDAVWQCLRWRYANMHLGASARTIAAVARELWPGVEVTTDPLLDYAGLERFAHLDVAQHWIRVHYAPRNPRSVAYYCERSRVHARNASRSQIHSIGPQLGRGTRATPKHMLSEACWLAVAFGAKGITHWGFQAIRSKTDGAWQPNGQAAWETLKRLRRELYDRHAKLLLAWKPVPRRMAMLVSRVDLAYASGQRGYAGQFAVENMYRALLSVGEPADVIYDVEVADDALGRYKVLVVPSLYVANRSLVEKIRAFAAGGGTVIAHAGSVLADLPEVKTIATDLAPVYKDYMIGKGDPKSLLPHQYAAWLDGLAQTVRKHLPMTPRVQLSSPRVIANLMAEGPNRYLVLVNDRRTYGREAKELGKQFMLDEGEPVDVWARVEGAAALVDLDTGKDVPVGKGGFRIRLEPGWGRILRIRRAGAGAK